MAVLKKSCKFIIFTVLVNIYTLPEGEALRLAGIFRKGLDESLSSAFFDTMKIANQKIVLPKWKKKELLDGFVVMVEPNSQQSVSEAVCKSAQRRAAAIIGPPDRVTSEFVEQWANKLRIPYLRISWNISTELQPGQVRQYTVGLMPHISNFMTFFEVLVQRWKWENLLMVYDNRYSILKLQWLLNTYRLDHVVMRTADVNDNGIRAVLDDMQASKFRVILLDFDDSGNIVNFLDNALQHGMMNEEYHYVLVSTDILEIDFSRLRHDHGRVTGFQLVSNTSRHNQVVQRARKAWRGTYQQVFPLTSVAAVHDAVMMFAAALVTSDWEEEDDKSVFCEVKGHKVQIGKARTNGRSIIDALREMSAYDGLLGRIKLNENLVRVIQEVRAYQLDYTGNTTDIGTFTEDGKWEKPTMKSEQWYSGVGLAADGLPHFRITSILEKLSKLKAQPGKLELRQPLVDDEPPYLMLSKKPGAKGNQRFKGFCMDLLIRLSNDLKFSYTMNVVKDGLYGDLDEYGNWNGMIGEIIRREADFAVAPLTSNYKRSLVVDFTQPFLPLGISILFKYPDVMSPSLMSFMNPLSNAVWLSALGCFIGIILILFIVARVSAKEWYEPLECPHAARNRRVAAEKHNIYTMRNTIWFTASTLFKGGCDFGPRATSTRIIGGFWWLFTLMLVSLYTANLAAVLTVERRWLPIKSLEDLANQTDIQYGALNRGSTMQFFSESKIDAHVKIWNYMKTHKHFSVSTNRDGVLMVNKGNYAYIMESSSLEYAVNVHCNLTQVGGVLGSKSYGIAARKGSAWIDPLTKKILEYNEKHIIDHMKKRWWEDTASPCGKVKAASMKTNRVSLNMSNVAGLFVILLLGMVSAFFAAVLEFFWQAKTNPELQPKQICKEMGKELKCAFRTGSANRRRGPTVEPTAQSPMVFARNHLRVGRGLSRHFSNTSIRSMPVAEDEEI